MTREEIVILLRSRSLHIKRGGPPRVGGRAGSVGHAGGAGHEDSGLPVREAVTGQELLRAGDGYPTTGWAEDRT